MSNTLRELKVDNNVPQKQIVWANYRASFRKDIWYRISRVFNQWKRVRSQTEPGHLEFWIACLGVSSDNSELLKRLSFRKMFLMLPRRQTRRNRW